MRQLFASYGEVTSAKVIIDRESGKSKGFGFVDMESGGDEAIAALDGKDFQGRNLKVNEARPRESRGGGGGGDRRGGGRRDRDNY
jgi:RNA recognition motif-containing protein